MGTKNAATVAQNAYTAALHNDLPKEFIGNIANFADDYLGGADTYEDLIKTFEGFLIMCERAGITCNPRKLRIGYQCDTFFGLNVENGKITPTDRNIEHRDPVKIWFTQPTGQKCDLSWESLINSRASSKTPVGARPC